MLSQAQSPLEALVGGEPSFEAGHWLLQAQAVESDEGSPVASTSVADSLLVTSPLRSHQLVYESLSQART